MFPGGLISRGVKLTTYFHLVAKLRLRGFLPPFLQYILMGWCLMKQGIRLYGVVLSKAQGQIYFYLLLKRRISTHAQ